SFPFDSICPKSPPYPPIGRISSIVSHDTQLPGLQCTWDSCRVQPGHLFVMGDNRGNSADGRVWGALRADAIKGKALFVWMSVNGSQQMVEWGPFAFPAVRWRRLGMKIQ
ncbi:MAG: S26 family signal peptidase, partial [Myxococcota bacterium]